MSEKLIPASTGNFFKEIKSLLFVIFIALMIRTLVFQLYFVPTGSMSKTILEGDYIFSTQYSYGYSKYSLIYSPDIFSGRIFAVKPQRGDIIIFRPSKKIKEDRYVKRLIGLPGDKIQIIDDVIHINDQPIKRLEIEQCTNERGEKFTKFKETLPNGVSYFAYKSDMDNYVSKNYLSNTEVFYVPKDKYFFMGDNRDNSKDSRFELGCVPFENFIAKAQFVVFSTKEFFWNSKANLIEQVLRVGTWITSIRTNRFFKNLYSLN